MNFRAEDYYRAGVERMRQARAIYKAGESYALAMYCGGLAVECILRAFRWRKDRSFDGRHDLEDLLKASELLSINQERMRRQGVAEDEILKQASALRTAMSEVVVLWHNNLRFASEGRLRAYLRQIDRLQGIKGNALKKNALDLLNAAQTIVDQGVALWTFEKK
jgi:HEPN domain-containing protein